MNKEIAHFFWHGNLTSFEETCIKSFVNKGFEVNLWSFTGLSIDGVTSKDASLILPESLLYDCDQPNDFKTKQEGFLAAFSDLFRYKLLSEYDGWWFDCDCYCLKNSDEYTKLRKTKECVVGIEDCSQLANSAVMFLPKTFAAHLYNISDKIIKQNKNIKWGLIGPQLISQEVLNANRPDWFCPKYYFYPISYDDHRHYYDINYIDIAEKELNDSYCVHILTHRFKENFISKCDPPVNSLLHKLFHTNYYSKNICNFYFNRDVSQINRIEQIHDLYNKILKRSPDREGLINYMKSGLSLKQIHSILLHSEEFKIKSIS